MEAISPEAESVFLEELRRRRAELRESMAALEVALNGPRRADPERWNHRVQAALMELSADLREHIDITEGPTGLYRELRTTAPRLDNAIARLTREHAWLTDAVDDLLALVSAPEVDEHVDRIRDRGTALLGTLIRHRQRGAELVYEAYEVDIGGGD